jgi:hypothetical protein
MYFVTLCFSFSRNLGIVRVKILEYLKRPYERCRNTAEALALFQQEFLSLSSTAQLQYLSTT